MLTGCATTSEPDHKVDVLSGGGKSTPYSAGNSVIANSIEGNSSFDPILKYGNERQLHAPNKRNYTNHNGEFSLDFVNIAIEEFISIVFNDMLKLDYVFDNSIKGDITVQTRGQVDSAQLLSIAESVLASRNAVMIPERDYYRIIPQSQVKGFSLKPELYSARKLQAGYKMVIIPVNYINPDDLKSILEAVAPSASHLKIDKARRAVVVAGTEHEIANVVDAIQIFDVNWLETKSIAVLPVLNTQAKTVMNEINKILNSQNKAHEIVLDTMDRFNALLVVANKKKEVNAVKSWLELLDKRTQTAGTQLFVYEVQNRKASELGELLNGIFNGEATNISTKLSSSSDTATVSEKAVVVTNKPVESINTSFTNLKKSSGELKFVSDETNNSLVILASNSEYAEIEEVIRKLDSIPLQVLIEVSIVEVTLTDELSYGVEWYLRHNDINNKYTADTTLDLISGTGIGAIVPGFSFVLGGTGTLVQAVFNTLASESKLNVISSPSLMALDNHTATIRVGDQQPVQVSSAKSTNNDVLTQSIEYKSTGVLLSVTPRVSSGGLVTMDLSQEVTDIGNIDDATGQRSFLQRNINSTVSVQDGNTIILGGLITENNVETESGVPGLSKIPLLGGLFSKTSNSKIKRELIVLITPKVISNHKNASDITREYASKMELLKTTLNVGE
jgi:general secretion pathway protein D